MLVEHTSIVVKNNVKSFGCHLIAVKIKKTHMVGETSRRPRIILNALMKAQLLDDIWEGVTLMVQRTSDSKG